MTHQTHPKGASHVQPSQNHPAPDGLCNAGYNAVLELICQHDAQIAGLHATINDLTARLRVCETRSAAAGPCSAQGGCACPPDATDDD